MTEIVKKKFEILEYAISDNFNANTLAEKLNELTDLVKQQKIVKLERGDERCAAKQRYYWM